MTTYKHFMGADVGKETLAICLIDEAENRLFECAVANTKAGMQTLLGKLEKLTDFSPQTTLICMEHTAPAARRDLLPADGQFFLPPGLGPVAPVGGANQTESGRQTGKN